MPIPNKKVILQATQAALIAVIEDNPVVKGTSVFINEIYKATGATPDHILQAFNDLTPEDIKAVIDQIDATAGNTSYTAATVTRIEQLVKAIPDELRAAHSKQQYPALHQLRPIDADFTGRQAELDQLRTKVQSDHLAIAGRQAITGLQGMGGIGKTQLALVIAHEIKPQYPDAQIFIDMQGYSKDKDPLTAADAMAHVVRSFNPESKRPDSEDQLAAEYFSILNGKRCLLLIDNINDESQIRPLIPPAGSKLITTTRNTESFTGLDAVRIDVMTEEDAVNLLEKITDRVKPRAKEIAAACGYLPLALTVAAHAIKTRTNITAEDYLRRLADQKRRIKAFANIHDHVFAVSDALIEDDQLRRRLYALAVFPGDFATHPPADCPIDIKFKFNFNAPAAVWQCDHDDAIDTLSDLMKLSLVEYDDQTNRYKLHDLVRDYVSTKITPDARSFAALHHAEHYANLSSIADKWYISGKIPAPVAVGLFRIEWPNIEFGFNWASSNCYENDIATHLCCNYPEGCINCLD